MRGYNFVYISNVNTQQHLNLNSEKKGENTTQCPPPTPPPPHAFKYT